MLSHRAAISLGMPPASPLPALPRLPQTALAAYAGAHFGKSLLWYAGELLLIYSLTEHAGLRAITAGLVLALRQVLSDDDLRLRLAWAAQCRAVREDADCSVRGFTALYQRLCAPRSTDERRAAQNG
ncbi:hypothetical protein NB713_002603 [Xanthomonas sacchari]|nr:hypothetical protein [Xanthomonas sacchari]